MTQKPVRRPKLQLDEINAKIVNMLNRHSPLDLTFSNVSRWTEVPRSTLYYYYGNSREKMIQAAVASAVKTFILIDLADHLKRFATWDDFQLDLLTRAADMVDKYPWAPDLYFRYRLDPGFIGQAVRELEDRYFAERTQSWMHFHEGQKPDWPSVRIGSVFKLGLLYGLQIDPEIWRGEDNRHRRDQLLRIVTQFVKTLHETRWVSG